MDESAHSDEQGCERGIQPRVLECGRPRPVALTASAAASSDGLSFLALPMKRENDAATPVILG